MLQGNRSLLKGAPIGQTWNNVSIKIMRNSSLLEKTIIHKSTQSIDGQMKEGREGGRKQEGSCLQ